MSNNTKMNPDQFLSDLYGRFDFYYHSNENSMTFDFFCNNDSVDRFYKQYEPFLPDSKSSRILDIGVGNGWFTSMCLKRGYTNLHMADFGCIEKFGIPLKNQTSIDLYDISTNLVDFSNEHGKSFSNKYDFIHLSHVIEHIPKHQLLLLLDNLFTLLNYNGRIFIRTPNLLGPLPFYYLYCTPGHEYGFIEDNLSSLLEITGHSEITFLKPIKETKTIKQKIANLLRSLYLAKNRLVFRLFQGRKLKSFHSELVVVAKKPSPN